MDIENGINDLLLRWSNERINADAKSICEETTDGYYAGQSDAYLTCLRDLQDIFVAKTKIETA